MCIVAGRHRRDLRKNLRREPRIGLALARAAPAAGRTSARSAPWRRAASSRTSLCGSSVGALVGGAFASGELERLEKWVTGLAWTTVVRLMDITWRGGLISGNRIFTMFRNNLFEKRDSRTCR